ncbi:MAG: DUF5668 domain-containing protein [Patescibacteria group bacterium]|jgi:hypothetical protein
MSCGLIIILLGLVILLENLNIIPKATWDIFWPLILIFLGIGMISSERKNSFIIKRWRKKDE